MPQLLLIELLALFFHYSMRHACAQRDAMTHGSRGHHEFGTATAVTFA